MRNVICQGGTYELFYVSTKSDRLLHFLEGIIVIREAVQKDVSQLAGLMGELGYSTTTEVMESRFSKICSHSLYNTQVAEMNGVIVGMIGMMLGFHYEKNE